MPWKDVAPDQLVAALPAALARAVRAAFADNTQRHSPEDLGDSPLMFGQAVTTNGRHLAADEVELIDDALVREEQRLWWVEFRSGDREYRVYLYKAPPGAESIEGLLLPSRRLRAALIQHRPGQMSLGFEGVLEAAPTTHLVVAMFGDSILGFERLEIGEPYLEKGRGASAVGWVWHERYDDPDYREPAMRHPMSPTSDDDGLRVRLRAVDDIEETTEGTG